MLTDQFSEYQTIIVSFTQGLQKQKTTCTFPNKPNTILVHIKIVS